MNRSAEAGSRGPIARLVLALGLAIVGAGCGSSGQPTALLPLGDLGRLHSAILATTVPEFRGGRPIFIYLPPGYSMSRRTYPVLLVLDGGSAFGGPGTFEMDRPLDSLQTAGVIGPVICVGIGSAPGLARFDEYIPYDGGEQFLIAVRDTLLPALRRRYRCSASGDSTYLLGASLGGLMSVYAGFAHDSTFARVAGLSVSYPYAYRAMLQTIREQGRGRLQRLYQDTGSVDDNPYSMLLEVETLADSLGFVPGCDIKSVLAVGGSHDGNSWSHRMPSVLAYLLGPQNSGCGAARAAPSL